MSMDLCCDGKTFRFSWMDDSYSQGAGDAPCPALSGRRCYAPDCPSNKKEAPTVEARMTGTKLTDSNVRVTVAIPVKLGGYTGQRDAWEEYERDYKVDLVGDSITFNGDTDAQRRITFSRRDLEAALHMIGGTKSVYRDSSRHQQGTGA